GEANGGSVEVEERHVMARTAAASADMVFAVGAPGMKGAHSLVRVIRELIDFGVRPDAIVPVLNRTPRSGRGLGRGRIEHSAAVSALLGHSPVRRVGALRARRVDDLVRA